MESGLCRAKNCVNILAKNFIVFGISSLAFLILGFGLMFGTGTPFFGTVHLVNGVFGTLAVAYSPTRGPHR